MPLIGRHCPSCKKHGLIEAAPHKEIFCPSCQAVWGKTGELDKIFDACPCCQNRQFYTQKDFNQAVGCLIMGVGICLVPLTYGLSLPVFALIDWLMRRKVKDIVVCYKCAAEFHDFSIPPHLKPFMHHIGLKYDKFR